MPHHKHSHSDEEICGDTPIDIDADLEHAHRLHNHMHHNLHQHVSNEISAASSLSIAIQSFHKNPNKNSTCVPCAYSNDIRPTTSLLKYDSKGNLADHDDHTAVSVAIADPQNRTEIKSTNPVVQQAKSN